LDCHFVFFFRKACFKEKEEEKEETATKARIKLLTAIVLVFCIQ
jgi:hypothetical protein